MPNDPIDAFLTTDELAVRWRCATRTLQRWRTRATGPHFHRIQGRILYAMADVIAFEQAHRSEGDQ